jgi:hypothetical protein
MKSVTAENLRKDIRVLGASWHTTYGSWFSNKKNINLFVKAVIPYLPKKKHLDILYVASASGLLGEALVSKLYKKGVNCSLTLLDASAVHLNENNNPVTKKIAGDLLTVRLKSKFDIILMRSSLDYFPSEEMQVKVLVKIGKWLKKNGIFANQTASLPTVMERDLADAIYRKIPSIGDRHFQCPEDISILYGKAKWNFLSSTGSGLPLVVTEKEHQERYKISKKEITRVRSLIKKTPARKRPNIQLTRKGYRLRFEFPIYLAGGPK